MARWHDALAPVKTRIPFYAIKELDDATVVAAADLQRLKQDRTIWSV